MFTFRDFSLRRCDEKGQKPEAGPSGESPGKKCKSGGGPDLGTFDHFRSLLAPVSPVLAAIWRHVVSRLGDRAAREQTEVNSVSLAVIPYVVYYTCT